MKKRKGSMIFDIILGLAAALFIMSVITPTIINWRFIESFKAFIEKTDGIIKTALLDPYKGYASANNEYCAPDYINSFQDLTAYRLIKCASIENNLNYYYDSSATTNETDPTKSYIEDLEEWTDKDSDRDSGCRYYFGEGEDTSKYKVFFDCSSLRKPAIADSEILTYYRDKYPTYLYKYDIKAISIDDDTSSGSDDDGMILLEFNK